MYEIEKIEESIDLVEERVILIVLKNVWECKLAREI